MDVMDSGCEADNLVIVDGDRDMMPWIFQKFLGQCGIDRIIEDLRGDVHENVVITGLQNFDFSGHQLEPVLIKPKIRYYFYAPQIG